MGCLGTEPPTFQGWSSNLRPGSWVSVILATLLLSPISAHATTTLDYDAYLAGAKVGGAAVTIERSADSYTIQGSAWSTGFLRR